MTKVLSVTEYQQEGIAVIEDTAGKYIATKDSDKIQVIPSFANENSNNFQRHTPCALLQSRESMLT